MTTINKGKVHLVGAGPGDPDLLTVKANKLLNKCDALIYDSLIPKEFLEYTSSSCRHFFCWKKTWAAFILSRSNQQIFS